MQVINVVKAFVLTATDGARHEIAVGIQEVEDFVADHWYAKAHTAPVPEALAKAAGADKGKKPATAPVPEALAKAAGADKGKKPATAQDAPPDTKAAGADTPTNAAAQ